MEIFLLVVGALILLQYVLSIQKNKWLGWILPILGFIVSIFYTLYMMNYSTNPPILLFTYGNIPTIVFICLRFASKDLGKLTNRKR